MPVTTPAAAPLHTPWAITAEGRRMVLEAWRARGADQAIMSRLGEPVSGTAQVRDGVAIIPVHGPLSRHENILSIALGLATYDSIMRDVHAAHADPAVRAIVLDVDSPGGEVNGCHELAEAIFDLRGLGKPIVAYVGGYGASAAYWIASACERVVLSPTGFLGSIGVRSMLVDDSAMWKKLGVEERDIISSLSPDKRDRPLDEDLVARAQAHVDALAEIFVSDVARFRGATREDVIANFGRGDVVMGEACLGKLADEISSLEAVLVELADQETGPTSPKGARHMPKSMNPANRAAARASVRAEGTPPNDPPAGSRAEGEEPMGKDEECAEDESPAAEDEEMAEHGEPDGDEAAEDEEDKPKGEDEKKEEEKAKAALARKLGLSPKASIRELMLAATATAVPTNSVEALVDRRVKAALDADARKRAQADARKRAEGLVARAVKGGWDGDAEDKKALADFAALNYKAAARSVKAHLEKADQLYARTSPREGDEGEAVMTAGPKKQRVGLFEIQRFGADFAGAAKALAAKENISIEAAQDRVRKEQPKLYDRYFQGG